MLKQGELLTLSNKKEYAVVSSIMYEGINYVYILDTKTYKDYKLCECNNERLIVVEDPELLKILIVKFNNDLKQNIASILESSN